MTSEERFAKYCEEQMYDIDMKTRLRILPRIVNKHEQELARERERIVGEIYIEGYHAGISYMRDKLVKVLKSLKVKKIKVPEKE